VEGSYPPDAIRALPFREQLEQKFRTLAARTLPADAVAQVAGAVAALDDLPDVRDLTGLLRGVASSER
jgi:hypothetical protein